MKKSFLAASAIATSLFIFNVANSFAQTDTTKTNTAQTDTTAAKPKVVGGAEMLSSNNIIENLSKSQDHTTLVSAIKTAGLEETLTGAGPFTIFAPHNDAFSKLPAGLVDSLLKPEKKAELAAVLTYHVVPGKLTTKDLAIAVSKGGGKAELTTVAGGKIYLSINDERYLEVADENGNIALVTTFDAEQANGIMHVINNVLLPKEK